MELSMSSTYDDTNTTEPIEYRYMQYSGAVGTVSSAFGRCGSALISLHASISAISSSLSQQPICPFWQWNCTKLAVPTRTRTPTTP